MPERISSRWRSVSAPMGLSANSGSRRRSRASMPRDMPVGDRGAEQRGGEGLGDRKTAPRNVTGEARPIPFVNDPPAGQHD